MGRLRYPMTISIVKIYVPLWRGFPLLYIFRTTTLVVYSRFHHVTTGFSLTTLTLTKMASKPSQKIALITGITGQVYITILDMLIVFSDFLTIFSFTYRLQISLGHGWGVVFGCCRWFRVLFFLRYDMSSTFHMPLKQSQSNGIPSLTKLHCWIKEHRLLVENVRTYRPKNKYL